MRKYIQPAMFAFGTAGPDYGIPGQGKYLDLVRRWNAGEHLTDEEYAVLFNGESVDDAERLADE